MAIVSNNIIGFASGSVGDVTLQDWKNRHILRSKPSIQYNPKTPAQQASRVRFEACRRFYRENEEILRPVFQRVDRKRNPFNAFAHRNLDLWSLGSDLIDPLRADQMRFGNILFGSVQTCRLDASAVVPWIHDVYVPYLYVGVGIEYYMGRIVYNAMTGESRHLLEKTYGGHVFWETGWITDPSDVMLSWFVMFTGNRAYVSQSYFAKGNYIL